MWWTQISKTFTLCSLLSCLIMACEPTPKTSPEQGSTSSPDATSPPADMAPNLAPLISGGGLSLTVEDFERAARRAMVFAPDEILEQGATKVPRARLQQPFLQASVTRQLIEEALIEREASRRGIQVSMAEVEALIRENEKLRRFALDEHSLEHALPGVNLTTLSLSMADLHDIARKQLLREKLADALISEIERDEVEQAWRFSQDRAHMLFVRVANTPTSKEIDGFLSDSSRLKDVESYFASHPKRFTSPGVVQLDLLRATSKGKLEDLKAAAAKISKGEQPLSDIASEYGLTLETGQRLVRKEDPRAFAAQVDEVGVSMQAPRGDYVWVVRGKVEASVPKLDRPLKREIAAILMRERNQVASARQKAAALIEELEALDLAKIKPDEAQQKVSKALDKSSGRRVKVLRPEWLQRDPTGFVRGVGTSEALRDAIFAMEQGGGVLSPAVPVDQFLWTGILLERQRPDMKDFDANYPRYLEQYKEGIKPKILDLRFASWQERKGIKAHMDVLRDHYGAYTKSP